MGQRNETWWLLSKTPVREDGTMLVERQYARQWRRLVIAALWRKERDDVFVRGRCPWILGDVLIPSGQGPNRPPLSSRGGEVRIGPKRGD